jgi:hypothetical protein
MVTTPPAVTRAWQIKIAWFVPGVDGIAGGVALSSVPTILVNTASKPAQVTSTTTRSIRNVDAELGILMSALVLFL